MKLLVIAVRGLGAWATGPYGNRWVETFALDTLAAGGVVFDCHLAAHPDPAAARRVWRTGRHHFPQGQAEAPDPAPDLLDVLHARGVATHLVLDTSRPDPDDFAAGWQHVRRAPGTSEALAAGRELLDQLVGRPDWLLWLEPAALLPPWRVPQEVLDPYFAVAAAEEDEAEEEEEEEDAEAAGYLGEEEALEPLLDPPSGPVDPGDDRLFLRLHKSYAAAVSDLDISLGVLLDGLPDDVTVLVTADHGLALGEHGIVGPVRPWLHAEVVEVPLLVHGPGCRPGRHVRALTSSVDLAPTIAELAGGRLDGCHGLSLVPLLGLEERPLREYVGLGWRLGEEVEWGLRTPGWALRVGGDGSNKLYVKPDDRYEVNDVWQHHFDRGEGMERTLRAFVAACAGPGPLQPPPLPAEE